MDNESSKEEKSELLTLSDRELLIATYNAVSQLCNCLWTFEQKQKEFFWKEFQELSGACQKIRGTFQVLARTIDQKDQTPLPSGTPTIFPVKISTSNSFTTKEVEVNKEIKLDIEL